MRKIIFLTFILSLFITYIVYRAVIQRGGTVETPLFVKALEEEWGCSDQPPRTSLLQESLIPGIQSLSEVEERCQSRVETRLMLFTNMPKDALIAREQAVKMAVILRELYEYRIEPLVVVEPDSEWGLIDFGEFNTGFYDAWIEAYFEELKAQGITDAMMGTWVPFPEANLPYWNHNNAQPEDFTKVVNRYLGVLKEYFPEAKGSVLLNSATYETDDWKWSSGEYVSLRPYLEGLNKDYIDSFGYQGLPWISPATEADKPIFEPAEFLNQHLAEEAADILGTNKIWFNTGTFAAKYTQDEEDRVLVPASLRKQILDGVLDQARVLRQHGYVVTINLFSEDKTVTPEATDWSYWESDYTANPAHEVAFLDFIREVRHSGFELSLFLR